MSQDDPYAAIAAPLSAADPYSGVGVQDTASAPLHTFSTKAKNGKTISFQAPADADDATIRELAAKATGSKAYLRSDVKRDGTPLPAGDHSPLNAIALGVLKPIDAAAGLLDKIPGLHEASDAIGRATGLGTAAETNAQHTAERANNDRTGYQTLGNIAGVAPLSAIPGALTFNGLALTGAAGGALLSDASDARGVAGDAGLGAVGNVIGGKIVAPALAAAGRGIVRGAQAVAQPLGALVRGAPAAAAPAAAPPASARYLPVVLKSLAAQPGGVEGSIARVAEGRARGVPLALMDSGDEARGLTSALSRSPGEARSIIRGAVIPRQEAQVDRIGGAITRDLGPVTGVATESQRLQKAASDAARPLYEKAYAAGAVTDPTVLALAEHPEMQAALASGRKLHANDAFIANATGSPPPAPLPDEGLDVRSLDYAKRALSGRIDAAYAGDSTEKMSAPFLKDLRSNLLTALDRAAPDYAAARRAYAGPMEMKDALEAGKGAIRKSADEINAATKDMSPAELDQYKLAVRSDLVDMMDGRVDGADKVKALIGSPKKRAALAQLFGGEAKFGQFMSTLADEGEAAATYGRVNTGSSTAANLADDGHLGGLTGVAANAGERALRGTGLVHNALSTLADLYRYGAGETGARARAELARTVSNMDPQELEVFKQAAQQFQATRLRDVGRTNATRRVLAPASTALSPRPGQ